MMISDGKVLLIAFNLGEQTGACCQCDVSTRISFNDVQIMGTQG